MPVVRQEKIEKRLMFPLESLLRPSPRRTVPPPPGFLNEVIDYLQSPGKLLLGNR